MSAAVVYPMLMIGTMVSAGGAIYSGIQQKKAYQQQAAMAGQEAQAQKVRAQYEEGLARTRLKKLIGQQRTLYAKAGVDLSSGSPLLMMADTQLKGEDDLKMIRYGGDVAAARARNQATLARFYGSQAATSGVLSGIGTAFSGFGQAGYFKKMSES